MLLAGDLFDGDWKDYNTGLFFVAQMARLREAGIPVFIVAGNHDAASRITQEAPACRTTSRFLSDPETRDRALSRLDVAVHGQGFATRSSSDDLAAAYPAAIPGLFNIGLLHTSLDGREGHATYAPTTARCSPEGLRLLGARPRPPPRGGGGGPVDRVPGQPPGAPRPRDRPQGVHPRHRRGRPTSSPSRTAPRRRCAGRGARSTSTEPTTTDELLDRVSRALTLETDRADGRALAVRVEVTGATNRHDEVAARPDHWVQEVRALGAGHTTDLWVEKVSFATRRPVDLSALAGRDDVLGGLLRELRATADNPEELAVLRDALADIRGVLPPELLERRRTPSTSPTPIWLSRLAVEARDLLLAWAAREGPLE